MGEKGKGGGRVTRKMQPYYVIEYVITDMIILQHWISRQNIGYTKEDINSFC